MPLSMERGDANRGTFRGRSKHRELWSQFSLSCHPVDNHGVSRAESAIDSAESKIRAPTSGPATFATITSKIQSVWDGLTLTVAPI